MRFDSYLTEYATEKDYPAPRSKNLSMDEAKKYVESKCRKHCKKLLDFKVPYIYRGIPSSTDDFLINDPRKGVARKSANTWNYMTMMMDNLPSWKKFPKRSKSLICSIYKSGTAAYATGGRTYVVLPFDAVDMGICPRRDVWDSFKDLGADVSSFNRHLNRLIMLHGLTPTKSDESWAGLKSNLKDVANAYYTLKKQGDEYESDLFDEFSANGLRGYFPILQNYFVNLKQKDFIKHLDKYLSPRYNNFRLNNLNMNDFDIEVWLGNAPCILIGASIFENFIINTVDIK